MSDRPIQWPACTRDVVERVEAKIRAGLAAMTPQEQEAFWAALPAPFRQGREPGDIKLCAECEGWHRRPGNLCGDCDPEAAA